jgi:hypothetical protein
MPQGFQRRLVRVGRDARPAVWSSSVLVSLLVGAATHSAWDSFTHGGDAGVGGWLPVLETRLVVVSGYTVYLFSVLQHLSSTLGMAALVIWIWHWYRRAPVAEPVESDVSPRARRLLVLGIALIMLVAAGVAAASRPPAQITLRHLQPVVRRIVVSSLTALVSAVTAYSVAWHWQRGRRIRL